MRGTAEDKWWSSGFTGGYDEKLEVAADGDATSHLVERVGSPDAVAFAETLVRRGKLNRVKGMVEA